MGGVRSFLGSGCLGLGVVGFGGKSVGCDVKVAGVFYVGNHWLSGGCWASWFIGRWLWSRSFGC